MPWEGAESEFSSELAEGALEWAEALYASVPPYRDGWSQIHPDDRADWLAGFQDLREPLESLVRWRDRSLLSRSQKERFAALVALKAQYDPLIRDLATAVPPVADVPAPGPADDYDLL